MMLKIHNPLRSSLCVFSISKISGAGLVRWAEKHTWSSPKAYFSLTEDALLTLLTKQQRPVSENEWSHWLSE